MPATLLDLVTAAEELGAATRAKIDADGRYEAAAARVNALIDDLRADPNGAARLAALKYVHQRLSGLVGAPAAAPTREDAPVPTQLDAVISAINDDTNALAAVVADLRSRVVPGMSQADVDAVQATLTDIETRLKGIAADPNNPVPPTPPPRVQGVRKK